jgi:hypothetical protein
VADERTTDDPVDDEQEPTETETPDPESEDEEDPQSAEDDTPPFDVEDLITRITNATTSQIDSRISTLMKTLAKDYGLAKKPKDADGGEPASNGRDPALDRALRAAARDVTANEFTDADERKLASGLVKALVDVRGLAADEDEEEVATALVGSVKSVLTEAKTYYEAAFRKDLEKRGLLDPSDPPQPGKTKTPKGPGASPLEKFRAGQERAAAMFDTGE